MSLNKKRKDETYERHEKVKNIEDMGEWDEVGGYHEGGTGTAPDGTECGECSRSSCGRCPVWARLKAKAK